MVYISYTSDTTGAYSRIELNCFVPSTVCLDHGLKNHKSRSSSWLLILRKARPVTCVWISVVLPACSSSCCATPAIRFPAFRSPTLHSLTNTLLRIWKDATSKMMGTLELCPISQHSKTETLILTFSRPIHYSRWLTAIKSLRNPSSTTPPAAAFSIEIP